MRMKHECYKCGRGTDNYDRVCDKCRKKEEDEDEERRQDDLMRTIIINSVI